MPPTSKWSFNQSGSARTITDLVFKNSDIPDSVKHGISMLLTVWEIDTDVTLQTSGR